MHDEAALRFLVNLIGEDKVALGTDYPFPLGELSPGKLIETIDIDQQLKSKLLGQNALDWLGLQPASYL